MGHSQARKQQTHEQIVQTAARRFRESGVDGVSIANLMKEAGLTHGGFYKHFESRDDLVAEALACALDVSAQRQQTTQAPSFARFVQSYLSTTHRDAVGEGCAMAALVNDVARSRDDARTLYTEHFKQTLGKVGDLIGGEDAQARAKAIVIFSALSGALGIARALNDEALSAQVLEHVSSYLIEQFGSSAQS
jgi:TetR/AcrR family transcriptional repressor of nem operon